MTRAARLEELEELKRMDARAGAGARRKMRANIFFVGV
jgi:hypothetical protein